MGYGIVEVKSERPSWIFGCIINDNFSLKNQLRLSFTIITVVAGGITLGICLGLLYALGNYTTRSVMLLFAKSSKIV
jgi:hypothetical protein